MIALLPLFRSSTVAYLLSASDAGHIVACDFLVDGCDGWEPASWGWETRLLDGRRITLIDHHADDPRFQRAVASGNLAIEFVKANGPVAEDVPVFINHTDCDSILSALIVAGRIHPEDRFGEAVLAADHNGSPNAVADLLQALDPLRDLALSEESLSALLSGEPLPDRATRALERRLEERCRAERLVADGAFIRIGKVAVAELPADEKISGELLGGLIPDAAIIIAASPLDGGKTETKIRLGLGAPDGATLFSLGVAELEPAFGGRWNAGSTKRSTTGSTVLPMVLARRLAERIG